MRNSILLLLLFLGLLCLAGTEKPPSAKANENTANTEQQQSGNANANANLQAVNGVIEPAEFQKIETKPDYQKEQTFWVKWAAIGTIATALVSVLLFSGLLYQLWGLKQQIKDSRNHFYVENRPYVRLENITLTNPPFELYIPLKVEVTSINSGKTPAFAFAFLLHGINETEIAIRSMSKKDIGFDNAATNLHELAPNETRLGTVDVSVDSENMENLHTVVLFTYSDYKGNNHFDYYLFKCENEEPYFKYRGRLYFKNNSN